MVLFVPRFGIAAMCELGSRASFAAGWSAGVFCQKKRSVPDGIRTHDLSLRRRTLYPAELRKHDS